MRDIIKQRIEQIRRGEVAEGYIKIKDGVFPSDWTNKKMKQWISLEERPTILQDEEEYELVTVRRAYGGVDSRGIHKGKDILVKNYFEVEENDFIISKRQIAHGACGLVPSKLHGAVVSNEYNVFKANQGTNIHFFNLMMQLPHYKRLFYLMSDGVHIEKLLFKTGDWMKRSLAMPSLAEQQKIAEILSAQDKLIALKEKLIEEKKRQKKALMQQLLTGKKRLHGFDEEWKTVILSKISKKVTEKNTDFKYDIVFSNSAQNGIIPQGEQFDKDIANDDNIDKYYVVRKGCFVYNPRISVTAPCGPINVNHNLSTGVMSPLYTVFTIDDKNIDNEYLEQYFKSTIWFRYMKSVANYGARHDRMSITDDDFFNMPIKLGGIKEQIAIRKILLSADSEIALLQKDLDQEKQKKKALMQLLLTGIVRVK